MHAEKNSSLNGECYRFYQEHRDGSIFFYLSSFHRNLHLVLLVMFEE